MLFFEFPILYSLLILFLFFFLKKKMSLDYSQEVANDLERIVF